MITKKTRTDLPAKQLRGTEISYLKPELVEIRALM